MMASMCDKSVTLTLKEPIEKYVCDSESNTFSMFYFKEIHKNQQQQQQKEKKTITTPRQQLLICVLCDIFDFSGVLGQKE